MIIDLFKPVVNYILDNLPGFAGFFLSLLVFIKTRKFLRYKERPIFSLVDQKIKVGQEAFIKTGRGDVKLGAQIELAFIFKNIGNHSANNLQISSAYVSVYDPNHIIKQQTNSCASEIKFGETYTYHGSIKDMTQHVEEFYIYILMSYQDAFNPKKTLPPEEFWLKFTVGDPAAAYIQKQDKIKLEGKIAKMFPNKAKAIQA